MRAVIQRVSRASVTVEGKVVGSIGKGICVLVGMTHGDSVKECDQLIKKITSLRLWPSEDESQGWKRNVGEIEGSILCVSQFTLYGKTQKGSKPDFHQAMKSEEARELYATFMQRLREKFPRVADGQFQAMMDVELVNDGPVTLIVDTAKRKEELVQLQDAQADSIE